METKKRSAQPGPEELLSLLDIAHLLASRRTFNEKMQAVAEELARATGAWEVTLRLVTDEPPGLRRIASAGPSASAASAPELLPFNEGLASSSIKEHRAIVSNDYAHDRRAAPAIVARGAKSGVALPIFAGENPIGALILGASETDQFPEDRVQYLSEVVEALSPLVHNARLQEEDRLRAEETDALFSLAKALSESGTFDERATRFVTHLERILGTDLVVLRTLDEETGRLRLAAGSGPMVEANTLPPLLSGEDGLTGLAVKEQRIVISNNYQEDQRAFPIAKGWGAQSALAAPVTVEGAVVGVIILADSRPGHLNPRRVHLMQVVADGVGVLLQNARLQEEEKLRAEETDALFSLSNVLAENGTFDERATKFVGQLETILGVDLVALRLLDDEGYLRLIAASGPVKESQTLTTLLPGDVGFGGAAVRENRIVVSNDYLSDPRALDFVKKWGPRSVLAVPVAVEDWVLGAIIVSDLSPDYFTPRRVHLMETIADGISVLLQNARLQEEEHLRVEELEALSAMLSAIATSGTFRERVAYAMERLAGIFMDATFVLWLGNAANDGARFVVGGGPRSKMVATTHPFVPVGQGAVGAALQTGESAVSNHYDSDPHAWEASLQEGVRSALALPVRVTDKVTSVLGVTAQEPDYFTPRRVRVLTAVAEGLTALIENARLAGQLQLLAVDISSREQQVLDYAADGLTNRMIARRLGVSENTIKFHMKNLMAKLEIRSRRDLRRR